MTRVRIELRHTRIPMRYTFAHAKASRSIADNVIARVELSDGSIGWGESVPREYVTGESAAGTLATLGELELKPFGLDVELDFEEAARRIWAADLAGRLSPRASLACAVEIALLDAYARREERNLAELFDVIEALAPLARRPQERVRRTLTIAEDLEGSIERAGTIEGPVDVKLKVGFGVASDRARAARVRELFGARADLRLDANGVWSLDDAVRSMEALAELDPTSVEEPLAPRAWRECAELRSRGARIMLDESVCSVEDAQAARQHDAADLLNLRVSKLGGPCGLLRTALAARELGLGHQIGSMVGETGILASISRSIAARLRDVQFFEAPIPSAMLEADITDASFEPEPDRMSPVPTSPGFGASVIVDRVERFSVAMQTTALDL